MKMFLRDFERFRNAFANGNARHHDDELRPAVARIELEHGLGIHVRFARACFHFHVKFHCAQIMMQLLRKNHSVLSLHLLHVGKKLFGAQAQRRVTKARAIVRRNPVICLDSAHGGLAVFIHVARAYVAHIRQRIDFRLSVEHLHHSISRTRLVIENGKFEFHRNTYLTMKTIEYNGDNGTAK